MTTAAIAEQAQRVADLLATRQMKVATAESCTGGLVAGALTAVPGISAWLCGGVVVYRNETKHALLGIPNELLANPGPVSEAVARLMAERVLAIVPEADVSIAITGHLGPQAPAELDGVVLLAVGLRKGELRPRTFAERLLLPPQSRLERQSRAVEQALRFLAGNLEVNDA